ncbi:Hypothetical protein, putative [Bodo saltans]|uniref:Uncharacterized protein n=1 Tax=Bodo saltans TaxID=75058 RepID=A0A0S4J9C9_BODSA|nr:Hypothetical protein, putative [Bodo saltans]|eukprot:CUG87968.1 Hypothetical protein, putative [Bodo saltans]
MLALQREIIKAENAARTNAVVEERADLAWIQRAYKKSKPKTPLTTMALSTTSSEMEKMEPMSSSSSSVDTDEEHDDSRTHSNHGALPAITASSQHQQQNASHPLQHPMNAEDEYQRIKLAQGEWESFEDRARELRRLVDGERDPEALRQLQHLKKPKLGRLKKSELPTLMVANRYMRAEETTQKSSTPPDERMGGLHDVAIMREQAARRRRMQVAQQQQENPVVHSAAEEERRASASLPPPPPVSRATKLPAIAPSSITASSSHATNMALPTMTAIHPAPSPQLIPLPLPSRDTEKSAGTQNVSAEEDRSVLSEEERPSLMATSPQLMTLPVDEGHTTMPMPTITTPSKPPSAAANASPQSELASPSPARANPVMLLSLPSSPQNLSSARSSPDRHATAYEVSSDIIAEAAQLRAHELMEANSASRRVRSEIKHIEEIERMTRSDFVDDEGESRREIMRNALMEHTAIIRKERELASAEREVVFRKELQQGEQRRHFSQQEQLSRQEIFAEYAASLLRVESSLIELRFNELHSEILSFQESEWESLLSVQESERKLCSRLVEERRVREEAERRIRVYAERRAREERERLFAEKHRVDVRAQMSLIATEIDARHGHESGEHQGYVELLQHATTLQKTVAILREELLKRQSEERLHKEREELRQRLAKEHADRRDLQLDEDKLRSATAKEATESLSQILKLEIVERQDVHGSVFKRLLRTLVKDETILRDDICVDEDTNRAKVSGMERTQVLSVLERIKHREADESKRAFEEADRALKEALRVKLEAAERLRQETEQMESERNARRAQDAEIRFASQFSLLSNEEQLHRQMLSSASMSEFETLQGREEAARDIVKSREAAAEERRVDIERSVERRRRDDEYEARLRRELQENNRHREQEEKLRRDEEDRKRNDEAEASAERRRRAHSEEQQSAHQRYAAIHIAQQMAEEEARRRKEQDAIDLESRRLQYFLEVVARVEDSQESERNVIATAEASTRQKLELFSDAHYRSSKDRETLRQMEGAFDGDSDPHAPLPSLAARPVTPAPITTPLLNLSESLSPARRRVVAEDEELSRDKIGKDEGDARQRVRDDFISTTKVVVKSVLDSQKETLAAAHPEIAALVAQEKERAGEERRNAILAAMYSLNRFEQEGRGMLRNAEDQAVAKLRTHQEHDCVLARGREHKRVAEEVEFARHAEEVHRIAQQRQEERLMYDTRQHLSLIKDEVMHRQVVELAEQADFDNTSSRALHGRVILETKESARLREQQRTLEHLATIAARTEVLLGLLSTRGAWHVTQRRRSGSREATTHQEHDCVLARGREHKRVAEEVEFARHAEEVHRIAQQRQEERLMYDTRQHLSLIKDEVMHRQVVELAEQADFDNTSSRALHGRVILETKESARLREQQRTLEHLATIAARTEVLLGLLSTDEAGKRTTIMNNQFSEKRLALEWFTTHELQIRAEDARAFAAEALKQTHRVATAATPIKALEVDQESSLDKALREKEESFQRARAQALDRSRPSSSMESTHPPVFQVSGNSRTSTPLTTFPGRRQSQPQQQAPQRPPSNGGNPFTELDIRKACMVMDTKTLALFVREEAFLRASIEVSEHAIRKDIAREERHIRRSNARDGNSPHRDRASTSAHIIKELQQEMESSTATESYLRGALEAEEHHQFLNSVGEARNAGIIILDHEVSPLRNHLPTAAAKGRGGVDSTAVQRWLRAAMEVVFQEEYHRREQIIAEYNRVQLELLMRPFEQELEYVQTMGEEVAARHAIESDEAVVTTKFLKRIKRQARVWDLLLQNSQDARRSILREFQELIKLLSRAELWSIQPLVAPKSKVPVAATTTNPLLVSPVPTMNMNMFPLEPSEDLPPSAWQGDARLSPQPYRSSSGSGVESSHASHAQHRYGRAMTDQELRDASIDIEIEHVKTRSVISATSLNILMELIRTANHCKWMALTCRTYRGEAAQLYDRREGTVKELIRSDMREQWGAEHHRLAISAASVRKDVQQMEETNRNVAYRYHAHMLELCALVSRGQRTRGVLFESVELEYVSVARLAEQRALYQKIGMLMSREEQARLSLNADEVFEFKRVRREIVDMLETKAKIDVEFINQKKRLVQDEEQVGRLQREWTFDLFMRLTIRFIRLQQVIEIAVDQFAASKQTWSLEQCLLVQQVSNDEARKRQERLMMVISPLSNDEQNRRSLLLQQEELFVRHMTRWNRYSEASASFSEKCLAAKIQIVDRLCPGLPPPPTVLQSRLPRLKSVLQRSASMAIVLNRVEGGGEEELLEPTPIARSPSSSSVSNFQRTPTFVGAAPLPAKNEERQIRTPDPDGSPSDGRLSMSTRSFRLGDIDRKASLFDLQATKSMSQGISPGGSMSFRRSPATAKFVEEDVQEAMNNLHTLPSKNLEQIAVMLRDNDHVLNAVDFSSFRPILTPTIVRTFAALSSQNTNVNKVSFEGIPITEEWVEGVARIANRIGIVDLTNCSLTDAVLQSLCNCWATAEYGSNLREIILDGNIALTAVSASYLANAARSSSSVLSVVSTRHITAITPIHVKWLAFYLDLNKQHRQFKAVMLAVEGRQEIPRLNFCIPRSKSSMINLKNVDQYRREFDDRSVRLLCIAVSNNTTVESVSFRGNRVTDKGVKLLATLLKKNRSIRELLNRVLL